jgi:hypothetical protein
MNITKYPEISRYYDYNRPLYFEEASQKGNPSYMLKSEVEMLLLVTKHLDKITIPHLFETFSPLSD